MCIVFTYEATFSCLCVCVCVCVCAQGTGVFMVVYFCNSFSDRLYKFLIKCTSNILFKGGVSLINRKSLMHEE